MYFLKALLFFVLSPGVLLTIPAGSKGLFMSGQTSLLAAAIHAVVFVIVLDCLYRYYQTGYILGFEDKASNESCAMKGMKYDEKTMKCVA